MNAKDIKKNLTRRQEEVLGLIVRSYVETAEPVGSRYIARKLDLSSATIRNVMADLEEMGYIIQPHTSAGRIPSDSGYRYYIDSLMRAKNVNSQIVQSVKEEYSDTVRSLEDALERTSHLISKVTNYVGVTLFNEEERLYLDGASHIVEQPEFHDIKKLYELLRYLEQKKELMGLLKHDFESESVIIYIGKENVSDSLSECSLVTKAYKVKGKISGRLGVIGPKRMVYDKVIPAVEFLADQVTEIFDDFDV